MNVQDQIKAYIDSQSEAKRSDLQALHNFILQALPECRLWFLDGKNSDNKTVSNRLLISERVGCSSLIFDALSFSLARFILL